MGAATEWRTGDHQAVWGGAVLLDFGPPVLIADARSQGIERFAPSGVDSSKGYLDTKRKDAHTSPRCEHPPALLPRSAPNLEVLPRVG